MNGRTLFLPLLAIAAACSPAPHATDPKPAPSASVPASASAVASAIAIAPPIAPKHPHATRIGDRDVDDEYFWLRNKGSDEVLSYLRAENAYTDAMSRPFAPLASRLYDEMLARVDEDESTAPFKDGPWLYFTRYEKGKQYPIYCRKHADGSGGDVVMLDVNELGKGEKYIRVPFPSISNDGNRLAFMVDTQGFRQFTLKTLDLRTHAMGAEAMPRVDAIAWSKDDKTIVYATEDAQTKRTDRVHRHVLGEDASKDTEIFHEADEMFDVDVELSRDKSSIFVTSASRTTTEVRVLDAAHTASALRVIAPREANHEYYALARRGDLYYIRTNSGGRNFRVVTAPVSDPKRANWKELVPHRDDVMLEDALVYSHHMVLFERRDALSKIEIYDFDTKKTHELPQPDPVYEVSQAPNMEQDATTVDVRYQSFVQPLTTIRVDMKTDARTVIKKTNVFGGYDPTQYESKRITIAARDGTAIPVSLVFRKGTQPDKTHPLHLYAYGSYGFASKIQFDSERVSLLDRGFVYALAHIRGGGDMGKRWHDDGRMSKKMNTFTDYIDVAEGLKRAGWARPDAIVASGRSAGGLLMGAVANMRPDLFRVMLAYVPFVDVINTMSDETLPLTVQEFEEWGNPKKPADLATILQYSPYDNVRPQRYPIMLVRSSYNDSQVMYWEPSKWVAKLRANKTDDQTLLFKIALEPASHGGAAGRYDKLKDTAFDYAFALSQLGMN